MQDLHDSSLRATLFNKKVPYAEAEEGSVGVSGVEWLISIAVWHPSTRHNLEIIESAIVQPSLRVVRVHTDR